MDFNSSFFENIIGIMIGSFISVITTIVVQLMNFKQEKKKKLKFVKMNFMMNYYLRFLLILQLQSRENLNKIFI